MYLLCYAAVLKIFTYYAHNYAQKFGLVFIVLIENLHLPMDIIGL